MALPRNNRLKKKLDFERVFKKGRAANGTFLFIKFRKSDSGIPRFGFVVSAKVAPTAVLRNKIRRAFSEAICSRLSSGHDAYDTAVVVTKSAGSDVSPLRQDLLTLLSKNHIL